jgi:SAM-dependent methyltransferase
MIHKTGFWDSSKAENFHIHSFAVSNWICNFFSEDKNKLIYDLGCGVGDYLNDLQKQGFTNLIGVEGDPINKHKNIQVEKGNLTEPLKFVNKGNVISLEVGEHIPREYQDIFIENVTNLCDNFLIVSWAVRGQGGYGHVNELNNDEILPLFLKKGFVLLEKETEELRKVPENYCIYFKNTLFVLKKI